MNNVTYRNEQYKVVLVNFGMPFGKLYGIFRNEVRDFNESTAACAMKKRSDAVKEADYLLRLNLPRFKKVTPGRVVE